MLTEISEIRAAATGDSKLAQQGGSQGPENRTQVFELLARTLTRLAAGKPHSVPRRSPRGRDLHRGIAVRCEATRADPHIDSWYLPHQRN